MSKRLLIVILMTFSVLVFLSLVSTVSAANVNWNVTNVNDNAPGSLRRLIGQLNTQSNQVTIRFGVSGPIPINGDGLTIKANKTLIIRGENPNGTSILDIHINGNTGAPLITIEKGATLILQDLTLKNSNFGGVIENQGTLELRNVVIRDSSTYRGGALRNSGTTKIYSGSFLVNTAFYGPGGAIYNQNSLSVNNSTFYVNWSFAQGGAIFNDTEGTVNLFNTTIVGNRANAKGGGVYNNNPDASKFTITNSIIASSSDSNNCDGVQGTSSVTLYENNIEFPGTGCGASLREEPRLGIITADRLPVLPLLSDSPAIDGVSSSNKCGKTPDNRVDQLGTLRPLDGNGDGIALCDIGAFEAPAAPTVVLKYSPAPIAPGGKTQLQIAIKNPNIGYLTLKNITFDVLLPLGLDVAEPINIKNCPTSQTNIGYSDQKATISVSNTTLAAGAECQISVDIRELGQKPVVYSIGTSNINSDQTAEAPPITPVILNVGIYSCTEAGFNQAIINGGSASFDCVQPTAIEINGEQTILSNTRLDGRGLVTLRPGRGYRLLRITSGNPLVINGMMLDGLQSIYIQSGSSLTIQNSTLTNFINPENGGAIDVRPQAQLTVFNSTFLNNRSDKNGGAIYVEAGGKANIYNTTFYGNSAQQGGAIFAEGGGSARIVNTTITSNTGGGIYHGNGGVAADVSLTNTLLVQNTSENCIGSAVQNSGNNLQFPNQTCGAGIPVTDPLLNPLNNYGGPTQTVSLKPGSPAINQGNNTTCAATGINGFDQRGFVRSGTCDIGAYEVGVIQPGLRLTLPPNLLIGEQIKVTVEVIDGNGNLIPGYRGTVKLFSSVIGENHLPLHTYEQKDGGKYDFLFTLTQAGQHTLNAVDTVNENISQSAAFYAYLKPILRAAFTPARIYGGATCLVLQLNNPNSVSLHNIVLFDKLPPETGNLPADLIVANDTAQSCSSSNQFVNAPVGGSTIQLSGTGFDLAPDETRVFGIKVSSTGKNDKQITDAIDSVSATEIGTLIPTAIAKLDVKIGAPIFETSFWPNHIAKAGRTGLYYRLYNPNGMDLTNVQFTTNLTNNLSFPIQPQIHCRDTNITYNYNAGSHTLAVNIPQIPAHEVCEFIVDIQGDVAGDLSIQSSAVTANEVDSLLSPIPSSVPLSVSASILCNANAMQDITWQAGLKSFARSDTPFTTYISQDGRFIAFESASTLFAPNDFNQTSDIFVYDRVLCKIVRVSEATDGTPANLGEGEDALYSIPAISGNGRYVTFLSFASNLAGPDISCPNSGCKHIYWHDLGDFSTSPSTQMVSRISTDGSIGDGDSTQMTSVTGDGRYVVFESKSKNLIPGLPLTGNFSHIFLRDMQTNEIKILSLGSGNTELGNSSNPKISANGQIVIFNSSAPQLTSYNASGIFMRTVNTNTISLVSVDSNGTPMNNVINPALSSDGRYVVFASPTFISPNRNFYQLYLRDTQAGTTTDISRSTLGQFGNGNSVSPSIATVTSPVGNRQFVAFTSTATDLDAANPDTNNADDVYVHDSCSGQTRRISVAISGETNGASYGPSISADAKWITFGSEASNLVNYDTNDTRDVFVVPNPLLSAQCPPPAPIQTFNGTLHILQGDPHPDLNRPEISRYALQTDDGQILKLQFTPENIQPVLPADRVAVQGQQLTSGAVEVNAIVSIQSEVQGNSISWIGAKPWLTLMCQFNGGSIPIIPGDPSNTPVSANWFNQKVMANQYPGQNHYWRAQSYNQMNLDGSNAQGWITLQQSHDYYTDLDNAPDGFINAAQDCFTTANIPNADNFAGINFAFNEELDGYAYGGSSDFTIGTLASKPITILPPWAYFNQAALAHELGHGFGLFHSSGPYSSPYDSRWDVMSDIWGNCPPFDVSTQKLGCVAVGLNAYHRSVLGWLNPPSQIVEIFSNQTMPSRLLGRLDQNAPLANQVLMIKVQIGNTGKFYTVEVHMPACNLNGNTTTCYDAGEKLPIDNQIVLQGVIIHRVTPADLLNQTPPDRPGELSTDAIVMDCDGNKPPCGQNGNPNDAGAVWTVGETFIDKTYGIRIAVKGQSADGYMVEISNGTAVGILSKPNLIAPVNNGNPIMDSASIHFQWTGSPGATGYEFQLGENNPPFNTNLVKSVQYNYPRLLPGRYYWRVRAVDNTDTANRVSEWSDTFTFTVQNAVNAPPVSPYYTTSVVTLTWNPVSSTNGYEIQVDNNIEFTSPEYANDSLSTASAFVSTASLPDGIYYWRLRAKTGSGAWGIWTPIQTFAVNTNG